MKIQYGLQEISSYTRLSRLEPHLLPVVKPVGYEVIAPDMVSPAGTEPDAGTVINIKPPSFRLFHRYSKPFLSPYPLHTLRIHCPVLSSKKCCNSFISIPAI